MAATGLREDSQLLGGPRWPFPADQRLLVGARDSTYWDGPGICITFIKVFLFNKFYLNVISRLISY